MFFAAPYDESTALAYGTSPVVQRAERILGSTGVRGRFGAYVITAFVMMTIGGGLVALPRLRTGVEHPSVRTQVSSRVSPGSAGEQITLRLDVR